MHGRASRLWRRVQHIAGTQNLGIKCWTPNLMFGKPTWTWNNADYSYRFMKNTYFKLLIRHGWMLVV